MCNIFRLKYILEVGIPITYLKDTFIILQSYFQNISL